MARDEFLDPVEQLEMQQAFAQPATGQEVATRSGTEVQITDAGITARKVDVQRDEGKVLQRIAILAAAAGTRWLYAYPVKQKGGGTKTIEGLSIKGANTVARLFGNCSVDCRVVDAGKSWLIYARFIDYESGFNLTRPFEQVKDGSRLGGEDDARRQQIAMSIGVSKAERNIIVNALQDHADFAFEAAKNSLVERVGKKLGEYKQRCIDRLGELNVATVRAERALGKPVENWIARDVARLIAEIKAVADGMATADEQWPGDPPPEPKRSDVTAAPVSGSPPQEQERAPDSASTAGRSWVLPADLLGQDAVILGLQNLCELANAKADVDAIQRDNADRIAKITGTKGLALNDMFRTTREALP